MPLSEKDVKKISAAWQQIFPSHLAQYFMTPAELDGSIACYSVHIREVPPESFPAVAKLAQQVKHPFGIQTSGQDVILYFGVHEAPEEK
jgi:hypothetical protein